MNWRKTMKICLLILLMCGAALILIYGTSYKNNLQKSVEISIITRAADSQKFAAMKLGMEQAASDFNANVSFINLGKDNDVSEQESLLKREAQSNVDAIILMAADTNKLETIVQALSIKTPIIALESPVTNLPENDMVVGMDHAMAKDLGITLLQTDVSQKKIGILLSSESCKNIQDRKVALLDTLKGRCKEIVAYHLPEQESEIEGFIKSLKDSQRADILIALESPVLDKAAQVLADTKEKTDLYGIGASAESVSYLENHVISGLMVQNEYNMGYIAVAKAVGKIEKSSKYSTYQIDYSWVNADNIYTEKNQALLFPLVR